ncbi:MFS general substrate transporter [Mycena alexandri]|uniref:MFS general substrate transporter n=1 Tax=Mycena alexandri TaxID=1745969 RepID=A0AAD6SV57_9AGAR|nr:MFS general substrate transporter [Mycena alexandri]
MSSSKHSTEKVDTSSESVPDIPALGSEATVDESRLLLKLDWRLLPIITLLYLWAFLDRTNIGNAKIAGLTADLKLEGLQYNVCAAVFFVSYCFFEVPSNMVLKKVRPNLWLSFIMFIWGLIMLCMAFVKNYRQLVAARFLLGIAEAGLLPGATFYLSQWYPRSAYGQRMGLFISASTMAGAFGGLLAYGIEKMNGLRNLSGWSWIFLVEGAVTMLIAFLGLLFLPDYPEKAKFLTEKERAYLVRRLVEDSAGLSKKFRIKYFWQAMQDYNSYLLSLLFLSAVIPAYCFAIFIPTIIEELGFSQANAQLMSTPPYIFACIVMLIVTRWSDKVQMRGPFILGIAVIGIVGYAVWYGTKSATAGYIAAFLACSGTFPNIALILSWAGNNTGGDLKRSVVLAMVIGLGNLGGVASSFVFRAQDAPRFHPGHGTAIGCICITFLTATFLSWNYRRLNVLKSEQLGGIEGKTFDEMGDASPEFRYLL